MMPPSLGSRARRIVRRTLATLLAGFVGLVTLGAALQACGVSPAPVATGASAPLVSPTTTVAALTTTATETATATAAATPSLAVVAPQGLVVAPAPHRAVPTPQARPAAPRTTTAARRPAPQPVAQPAPKPAAQPRPAPQPAASSSYANCTAARAAGAAPLYRGQPGYAPKLDRDDDGIACET